MADHGVRALLDREQQFRELDHATLQFATEQAEEIRRLGNLSAESMIEMGRRLTEVKERLPHGAYEVWLKREFNWSESQARRFRHCYEVAKTATVADLKRFLVILADSPGTAYAIAQPSTPKEARQEALDRVEQGEKVTPKAVKEIAQRHKTTQPAAHSPERIAAAKFAMNIVGQSWADREGSSAVTIHGSQPEVGETINLSTVEPQLVPYKDRHGFVHRYQVPNDKSPTIDVAWAKHAPSADVAKWLAVVRPDDLGDVFMALYEAMNGRPKHECAKAILQAQLRETDLTEKQKDGLSKVLEALTTWEAA